MPRPWNPQLAWIALAAVFQLAAPARGTEIFLSGDLGISFFEGRGVGTNDLVNISNSGRSEDKTPVWGGSLGVMFPMNALLPWRMRGFGVPYWPGHEWRVGDGDDFGFPDWGMRFEVEHLRGRDAELTTPGFSPNDSYRSDVQSWTLMGKLRLDVPVRAPIDRLFGRVPFLEPFTIYGGGGAGIAENELAVSASGLLVGDQTRQRFAWQVLAGIGYELNEHMSLSVGWRYLDLGEAKTQLVDSTFTNRGRYSMDLEAHEFTASLAIWFYRLPPLLGDE
jgi:outer membrane protein with beta-barrel domain